MRLEKLVPHLQPSTRRVNPSTLTFHVRTYYLLQSEWALFTFARRVHFASTMVLGYRCTFPQSSTATRGRPLRQQTRSMVRQEHSIWTCREEVSKGRLRELRGDDT
jgi:hypothetical protein